MSEQISNNIMTPHEFAKLCGTRATMLMNGSKPTVNVTEQVTDVFKIVYEEIRAKKIPLHIIRYLPGNRQEEVDPNTLFIDDSLFN